MPTPLSAYCLAAWLWRFFSSFLIPHSRVSGWAFLSADLILSGSFLIFVHVALFASRHLTSFFLFFFFLRCRLSCYFVCRLLSVCASGFTPVSSFSHFIITGLDWDLMCHRIAHHHLIVSSSSDSHCSLSLLSAVHYLSIHPPPSPPSRVSASPLSAFCLFLSLFLVSRVSLPLSPYRTHSRTPYLFLCICGISFLFFCHF